MAERDESEDKVSGKSVSQGGFVAGGDQEVHGDVISVSNVSDSAVAAGRGASATIQKAAKDIHDFEEWRAYVEAKIEATPRLSREDKNDLKDQVAKIEEEASKDREADVDRLERLINVLAVMAPDIFDVAVATLANPLAGIGLAIKKIGEKAKVESVAE